MSFSLRVVLIHPRNPLNMGAAARAMANFGFEDLAVVAPYDEAWRTARSARAGAGVLARARCFATLKEAIGDCDWVVGTTDGAHRAPEIPLQPWSAVAAALPPRRVALLFGSEKTGLGVEEISHCRQLARLPTVPGAPSMNLGQAVALCCYELRRGRAERSEAEPVGADRGQAADAAVSAVPEDATMSAREILVERFLPVLERLGVSRAQHRSGQRRRLREMLVRWRLSSADCRLLLGVAREFRRELEIPEAATSLGPKEPT